jgi:hypothetical protein
MSNRVRRGPAWAEVPFYNIENQFWPDRKLMLGEAEAVRSIPGPGLTYIADVEGTNVSIEWKLAQDHTPLLSKMLKNFQDTYGDLGSVSAKYFYIDAGSDYRYHVDNEWADYYNTEGMDQKSLDLFRKKVSINCCINVVLTDDESECEFKDVGKFKYTAGVLNTSHMHRVKPDTTRILGRISFSDAIYEEVVHRIRSVDKKR